MDVVARERRCRRAEVVAEEAIRRLEREVQIVDDKEARRGGIQVERYRREEDVKMVRRRSPESMLRTVTEDQERRSGGGGGMVAV